MRVALLMALVTALCVADTVVLRDGTTKRGTFLGANSRQLRLATNDSVEMIDLTTVRSIDFGDEAVAGKIPQTPESGSGRGLGQAGRFPDRGDARQEERAPAKVSSIPSGQEIVVRLIDPVDSSTDKPGSTYKGSLDEPIVVDGTEVAPKGADVVIKLVDLQQAGRVSGSSELTLDLSEVFVNGRRVAVNTSEVTQKGGSRTKRTVLLGGGGAAVGAIIGAIAGGGKGAAIGAATGAGAGAAGSILMRGPKVRVPSETVLTFILQVPVTL